MRTIGVEDILREPVTEAEYSRLRALFSDIGRRGALRDPFVSMCEHVQLTPPQFHSLWWLGHEGPLPMGELARRLAVTEKTVTGVVDRMEALDLVVRERDTLDRRVVRVQLTPHGQETHEELARQMRARIEEVLSVLDAAERNQLFDLVEKLIDRLNAAPPVRGREEQE